MLSEREETSSRIIEVLIQYFRKCGLDNSEISALMGLDRTDVNKITKRLIIIGEIDSTRITGQEKARLTNNVAVMILEGFLNLVQISEVLGVSIDIVNKCKAVLTKSGFQTQIHTTESNKHLYLGLLRKFQISYPAGAVNNSVFARKMGVSREAVRGLYNRLSDDHPCLPPVRESNMITAERWRRILREVNLKSNSQNSIIGIANEIGIPRSWVLKAIFEIKVLKQ